MPSKEADEVAARWVQVHPGVPDAEHTQVRCFGILQTWTGAAGARAAAEEAERARRLLAALLESAGRAPVDVPRSGARPAAVERFAVAVEARMQHHDDWTTAPTLVAAAHACEGLAGVIDSFRFTDPVGGAVARLVAWSLRGANDALRAVARRTTARPDPVAQVYAADVGYAVLVASHDDREEP